MSLYQYPAQLSRVVDGDTVYLDLDLGFGLTMNICGRLQGVDTFELRDKSDAKSNAAKMEKEYLEDLLKQYPLWVHTHKTGKYGRWLVKIYAKRDGETFSINKAMADYHEGFGYDD